ncbi:MAG: ComEA family DNA-binding protein [Planctomycetes bacterium]|nr:ComEA family DNA-binding protein [Planctomycetota bacterium]
MATPKQDWTTSAAKWIAVGILGSASITGIVWTIASRPQPTPPTRAEVAPDPVASEPDRAARPGSLDAGAKAQVQAETKPDPTPPRLINVNIASAAELELLPGIGPTLAARIVADREANGPFASLDDVARVRGIGPRTVDKIRDLAMAR